MGSPPSPNARAARDGVAVENFGAGDVIEIERPDGKRFMVPMRDYACPSGMPNGWLWQGFRR
jgi:hypothetical protein